MSMIKVDGRVLINLGYKPGKYFGVVLNHAKNVGFSSQEDLIAFVESVKPEEVKQVPLKNTSENYYINLEYETQVEQDNYESVIETMDILMKTPTVIHGAVMPDACPAGPVGTIPVGGVVATKNAIHPAMHSADICCSMFLTNFGSINPKDLLDIAQQVTHFGPGGREKFSKLPSGIETSIQENPYFDTRSIELASYHLGTQGDGNHFLYVGILESTGETVMVTHHGSRGFGAYLYKNAMKVAENFRRKYSPETLKKNAWIPFDTKEGQDYWKALQIVREWTKKNHTVIHDEVVNHLNVSIQDRYWNEHNFVFRDNDIFYHGKGATPLKDSFVPDSTNGLRLVPLNMAQPILVVKGKENKNNLGFSPHGAGRNMSRSQHKKLKGDNIEQIFKEETKGIDMRFYSGNIDISELPSAYKNADQVRNQINKFNLGTVVDLINPYGCIMAGDWGRDAPWRKNK